MLHLGDNFVNKNSHAPNFATVLATATYTKTQESAVNIIYILCPFKTWALMALTTSYLLLITKMIIFNIAISLGKQYLILIIYFSSKSSLIVQGRFSENRIISMIEISDFPMMGSFQSQKDFIVFSLPFFFKQ